ncbi:MAG: polysaccharide deacetylase family protein [Mediterranea sp.]|nr:polysaccharide deacetylase family protein [Mediterranea sp.]
MRQICEQLKGILPAEASAQSPTVSVTRFAGDRQAALSLTFDDGLQEHYTLVAPHLDRYALKGTFGINGKYMGDIDDHYAPRMTWDECRQMARDGHEINNHTWSHPNLHDQDSITIVREIAMNDSAMMAELGFTSRSVLYPFNGYNDLARRLSERGKVGSRLYQFALGQRNSGCTPKSIDKYLDGLIEKGAWGITMTHGIYTAWDQWDEPWALWDFFRDLAFRQDSVWVDTFSAIQAYTKARDAVGLTTRRHGDTLVISPSLSLDSAIFRGPLTLRIAGTDRNRPLRATQDGRKLQVSFRDDYSTVDIDPYGSPIEVSYAADDALRGKKLCVIGDSYVYNHARPASETWHAKVAAKHGMAYENLGRNGNSIAFERDGRWGAPMYQRYTVIPKDADYILLIAGHNDAYIVNEDIARQEVLRQRLDELLGGLEREYPHAKIGWVTPWNVAYKGFPATLGIIREVCRAHGVKVLDAARTSGIRPNDPAFRARYFQRGDDTAHLNNAGHDLLVRWGEQFLMGL